MGKKNKNEKTKKGQESQLVSHVQEPSGLVAISTVVTPANKQLLQVMKAVEGRPLFEILGDALQNYAREHHPDIYRQFG